MLAAGTILCGACAPSAPAPASPGEATREAAARVRAEDVRASLHTLAADSMEGRMTASPGAARAARFIAAELRSYGIEPAGDASGPDSVFFQRVPLVLARQPDGRRRLRLPTDLQRADTIPVEGHRLDVNVVGVIRGSDPVLRHEAVVVNAHYDHVGIGRPVDGDSIYNGADDNATGVVAVLEVARALARGPAPRRTVVFLLTTGEEVGLLGTRWYLDNPVVPLEHTVATLVIEMIGRPDSLAGGPGRGWLTGYERSTMGEMLAAARIPIIPDPRPEQNFFMRSDNIAFARRGIPAHTLSSFGLHTDYHQPSDEVRHIDFAHMTQLVDAAVRAVRVLADGPAAVWHPGGRP
jgi:hypothetical protein